MTKQFSNPPMSTFVVRLRREWSADGPQWRGWIEHVQSGQHVGFQGPEKMIDFIRSFDVFVEEDDLSDAQDSEE